MPRVALRRSVECATTPRTLQLAAMFDVTPTGVHTFAADVDVDIDARAWNVGLIVGPSGSGKSSVARELWGDAATATDALQWSSDRSVVDDFPPIGGAEIAALLGSVGFNTPPAWLKPYRVLSNGEQFRVSIARVLAEARSDPLVVDEFTSVVDRQVAKIAAHSVQRAVRKRNLRFVAVSCHYDIEDWLQPDWILDMADGTFTWRSLRRRPPLEVEVRAVSRELWRVFAPFHYMSGELHRGSQCFGGFIDGRAVAFAAYLHFPHPKTRDIKHGTRLVVLPDYQGLGIGGRLDDWIGSHLYVQGYRYRNVVAHPAMIATYLRSPRWRETRDSGAVDRSDSATTVRELAERRARALVRRTRAFEYVPTADDVVRRKETLRARAYS